MKPESQLHPRDSKFYGWATGEAAPEGAMKLKQSYVDALLSLPRFVDMDIVDLYRMAEEKLVYAKGAGTLQGTRLRGIQITDRAFAIAIILGCSKIDNPLFQMPTSINFGGEKISL